MRMVGPGDPEGAHEFIMIAGRCGRKRYERYRMQLAPVTIRHNRGHSKGARLLLAAALRWGRSSLRRWAYRVELSLLLVVQRGVEVLKVRAN